jgi:hypothetical protein
MADLSLDQRPRPGRREPQSRNWPKGAPYGAPFFTEGMAQGKLAGTHRPAQA